MDEGEPVRPPDGRWLETRVDVAARKPTLGTLPWLAALVAGGLAYLSGYQARAWVNDTDAAVQPAWALVHHGTLRVPDDQFVPLEFVRTGHGVYSNRPLGMILASVPGQLFSAREPSELGSAVIAAVLCAAIAFVMVRMFGRVGLVAVFGAPLLYVAGRTLWPETVGLLGLLIVLALARRAPTRRGALVGVTVVVAAVTICRLPLGLLLVPLAAVWADDDTARRWWRSRTLLAALAGFAIGALVLGAYARWQFGSWSPAAEYPGDRTSHWAAVLIGLFSPVRGLLFWSPFVLTARLTRRGATAVAWAAAYTLGTWFLYNVWGGQGYVGYRYALPLAFVVAPFVCTDTAWRRALVSWSVGLGLTTTVLAAKPIAFSSDWTHTGMPALVFCYGALLSLVVFGGWEYLLRRRPAGHRIAPAIRPQYSTS
jgi:hypothetical protein